MRNVALALGVSMLSFFGMALVKTREILLPTSRDRVGGGGVWKALGEQGGRRGYSKQGEGRNTRECKLAYLRPIRTRARD